jgi:hypothetical protein
MVFPGMRTAPQPSPDMPVKVRDYYEEAAGILERSPKGAAALLRLAIELIAIELGATQNTLDQKIGHLVGMGLPPMIKEAMDAVRATGGNAVHPGHIDLDDNRDIAASMFPLVNIVVDRLLTEPKQVQAIYDKVLTTGQKQHVEKRDAGTTEKIDATTNNGTVPTKRRRT